ncbi:MAG: zf-TFIIB domain-containing protein [Dehalococcoidales bacterium]|jgi:hypothetical protein
MICPVCKKDALIVEYNHIELDYCPSCGGVWFDAGELEMLLEAAGMAESRASWHDAAGPEAATGEKKRRCPICRHKMKKSHIDQDKKVLVDICGRGHGIWFDGGEVQQLIAGIAAGHAGGDTAAGVLAFVGEMLQYQSPGEK